MLATRPDHLSSIPRTHGWRKRTDSHTLSSDVHTCIMTCAYHLPSTHTDASMQLLKLLLLSMESVLWTQLYICVLTTVRTEQKAWESKKKERERRSLISAWRLYVASDIITSHLPNQGKERIQFIIVQLNKSIPQSKQREWGSG